MNTNRIETLNKDINELRRKLYLADAEAKAIDKKRANVQSSVSRLKPNPANREKSEEAERELQNYQQEYNILSRNYYNIMEDIRRKNTELVQEETIKNSLQRTISK